MSANTLGKLIDLRDWKLKLRALSLPVQFTWSPSMHASVSWFCSFFLGFTENLKGRKLRVSVPGRDIQ